MVMFWKKWLGVLCCHTHRCHLEIWLRIPQGPRIERGAMSWTAIETLPGKCAEISGWHEFSTKSPQRCLLLWDCDSRLGSLAQYQCTHQKWFVSDDKRIMRVETFVKHWVRESPKSSVDVLLTAMKEKVGNWCNQGPITQTHPRIFSCRNDAKNLFFDRILGQGGARKKRVWVYVSFSG